MPFSLSQYKKSLIDFNFHIRNRKDIKIIPYHICQDHPVMCLPMNEKQGLIARDFSGVNDGHINGGVTWLKHGMLFNGSTGYLNCGNNASLNMGINDFSIELWFKTNNSGTMYLIQNRTSGLTDKGFYTYLNNGQCNLTFCDGSANRILATGIATNLDNNQWYHYVIIFDRNDSIYHYLNGINDGSTDISSQQSSINNAISLYVGISATTSLPFDGNIAAPRIYNYALSPKIIAEHFNKEKHTYGV